MQVCERSGAVRRCFNLQDHLEVVLSNNRHRRAALLKGSKEHHLVRKQEDFFHSSRCSSTPAQKHGSNVPLLSSRTIKVLYFDNEGRRAAFVRLLHQSSADVGVKEMREEELLQEALTREQRAQIVETFIRHAFSKVSVSRIPSHSHRKLLVLGSSQRS